MIAAGIAQAIESFPPMLFLAVVAVTVFEFGFFLLLALVARPLARRADLVERGPGERPRRRAHDLLLLADPPVMREKILANPLGSAMTSFTMERIKKAQTPPGDRPQGK